MYEGNSWPTSSSISSRVHRRGQDLILKRGSGALRRVVEEDGLSTILKELRGDEVPRASAPSAKSQEAFIGIARGARRSFGVPWASLRAQTRPGSQLAKREP